MKAYHTDRRTIVCKSKAKYGNLKSAENAANVLSKAFNKKHTVYKCGESKHYHLTTQTHLNTNKKGRI